VIDVTRAPPWAALVHKAVAADRKVLRARQDIDVVCLQLLPRMRSVNAQHREMLEHVWKVARPIGALVGDDDERGTIDSEGGQDVSERLNSASGGSDADDRVGF
jgi:hypothetical protein